MTSFRDDRKAVFLLPTFIASGALGIEPEERKVAFRVSMLLSCLLRFANRQWWREIDTRRYSVLFARFVTAYRGLGRHATQLQYPPEHGRKVRMRRDVHAWGCHRADHMLPDAGTSGSCELLESLHRLVLKPAFRRCHATHNEPLMARYLLKEVFHQLYTKQYLGRSHATASPDQRGPSFHSRECVHSCLIQCGCVRAGLGS